MPYTTIRNVALYHEVLGERGPWLALTPGGRRSLDEMRGVGRLMAGQGYRVLLHDRRNTGRSGISFEGEGSEFEVWADDLEGLFNALGVKEAILGGSSSGCRMSILMALRHPARVRALLLMRVTGGEFAVRRLSHRYYTKYIEAVDRGGMEEVCRTEHFEDLVRLNPDHRRTLLALDPIAFRSTLVRWRDALEEGLHTPILGATLQDLQRLSVPVLILPGNDNTHSRESALKAQAGFPDAEVREIRPDHCDVDILPMKAWADDAIIAGELLGFLQRRGLSPAVA